MACPGGCIGGGGQPILTSLKTIEARTKGLNIDDKQHPLRKSHENPEIKQLYQDFLKEPLSHLSHHLLHTTYRNLCEKTLPLKAEDLTFESRGES